MSCSLRSLFSTKTRRKNVICICLCLSLCSWKTFWHSDLCGGDNFSRLQSLTKCWHTVFKWGSWGKKQSALLPSSHHSMLWCLLLYSFLVAHTVQQHSSTALLGEGEGGTQGRTLDFKWQGWSIGGKNQNQKESLDQNLTPQKFHTEFPSCRNFQKAETGTELVWFYFIHGTAWLVYVGTIIIFRLLWIPPKTPT